MHTHVTCAFSGREAYVVAGEVVDGGFGEHAVVCSYCQSPFWKFKCGYVAPTFQLALPQGRCVTGDDDEFGLA